MSETVHRGLVTERLAMQRRLAKAKAAKATSGPSPSGSSTAHPTSSGGPGATVRHTPATTTSSSSPAVTGGRATKPRPKAKAAPPRHEDMRALVPCRYFVANNGLCPAGTKCHFSHHPGLIGMQALLRDGEGENGGGGSTEGSIVYPPEATTFAGGDSSSAGSLTPTEEPLAGPSEATQQPNVDQLSYEQLQALCDGIGKVKVGVPASVLQRLPSVTVRTETKEQCSVCLEGFQMGDTMKFLPCEHPFHPECIDEWLTSSKKCPNCNVNVSEESAYEGLTASPSSVQRRPPVGTSPATRAAGGVGASSVGEVLDSLARLQMNDGGVPVRPGTGPGSSPPPAKKSPPKPMWRP